MKKVWVNGCFDIVHRGHIELFKYAKAQGDYLIVGLDEDDRVSASKGEARPINKLEDRAFVLQSIKYIDEVGDDWKNKKIIGGHLVDNKLYFNRLDGYSTTGILENG